MIVKFVPTNNGEMGFKAQGPFMTSELRRNAEAEAEQKRNFQGEGQSLRKKKGPK